MLRKLNRIITFTLIGVLMCATPMMATPSVILDSKQLSFDVPPLVENNRTLVPLRAIFEAMGAAVTWDQASQTATAIKSGTTVVLTLGSTTPTINGQIKQLDVPAMAVNGRILAPLRFVGEAFGGSVAWDQDNQLITILTIPGSGKSLTKVHFIDVGQADSIYIQLPDHNDILIDGGNVDDGPLVTKYLKDQGVDDIELMIATHPHEDHIGGLPAVLAAFQAEKIIDSGKTYTTTAYKNYLTKVKAEAAMYEQDDYQTFNWGNISLKILTGAENWDDIDNYSVISRLDCGNIEFFFPGDAAGIAEGAMLGDISSEILKVGHHGSSTSSRYYFLNRIEPQVAVISVGAENDYGHPHEDVLTRLHAIGAEIYRTDLNGTVVVSTDGITYTVATSKSLPIPNTSTYQAVPVVSPQPGQNTGVYFGSIKSDKYHLPGCSGGEQIYLSNRIWFNSEAEALAAGYVPCKICNP